MQCLYWRKSKEISLTFKTQAILWLNSRIISIYFANSYQLVWLVLLSITTYGDCLHVATCNTNYLLFIIYYVLKFWKENYFEILWFTAHESKSHETEVVNPTLVWTFLWNLLHLTSLMICEISKWQTNKTTNKKTKQINCLISRHWLFITFKVLEC